MIRFILLTFGFLGWAFYEMSGGADFEPLSERLAAQEPVQEPGPDMATREPAANPNLLKIAKTEKPQPDTQNDVVTRVSLNLTTLGDLAAADAAEQTPKLALAVDDRAVPENIDASQNAANTPAIIPSLILPGDSGVRGQTVTASSDAVGDLRSVSGNRVNVREGPGTEYGVVNSLVLGDMVEVLDDSGTGWVRMRPVDGGPEGWMADFLLDES